MKSIQYAGAMKGKKNPILIISNGLNIILAPKETKRISIRTLRIKNGEEKVDYKTGEATRDAHGNIRLRDRMINVFVYHTDGVTPHFFPNMEDDLWNAVRLQTYEYVYTAGTEIQDEGLLAKQAWFEPGMRVFTVVKHRLDGELATTADIVQYLEKQLAEKQTRLEEEIEAEEKPAAKSSVPLYKGAGARG